MKLQCIMSFTSQTLMGVVLPSLSRYLGIEEGSIASSKKSPRPIAQIAILSACLFWGRIYFLIKIIFR
jgi:hypothetical protein